MPRVELRRDLEILALKVACFGVIATAVVASPATPKALPRRVTSAE
jgi:hypothetical protein